MASKGAAGGIISIAASAAVSSVEEGRGAALGPRPAGCAVPVEYMYLAFSVAAALTLCAAARLAMRGVAPSWMGYLRHALIKALAAVARMRRPGGDRAGGPRTAVAVAAAAAAAAAALVAAARSKASAADRPAQKWEDPAEAVRSPGGTPGCEALPAAGSTSPSSSVPSASQVPKASRNGVEAPAAPPPQALLSHLLEQASQTGVDVPWAAEIPSDLQQIADVANAALAATAAAAAAQRVTEPCQSALYRSPLQHSNVFFKLSRPPGAPVEAAPAALRDAAHRTLGRVVGEAAGAQARIGRRSAGRTPGGGPDEAARGCMEASSDGGGGAGGAGGAPCGGMPQPAPSRGAAGGLHWSSSLAHAGHMPGCAEAVLWLQLIGRPLSDAELRTCAVALEAELELGGHAAGAPAAAMQPAVPPAAA